MNQNEKRKRRVHFQAINLRVFKVKRGEFYHEHLLSLQCRYVYFHRCPQNAGSCQEAGLDDIHVEAFSVEILDQKVASADVVLLGPQIRHMLGDVKKVVNGKCPVDVVDMRDYGTLRGDKILAKALQMAGK